MAQTVQRKQKRGRSDAIEPQDSTPPAPKRVRTSNTARKSTGGREPRRERGDDDGEGDDRRPGPSRQRTQNFFFSTRRKAIDALWHGWVGSHRPRFRCRPRRSSEEASVQTRYRRPSRDPQVPEKHGPAFAQASVCTRRMQYFFSSPRMAPTHSLGRCARLRWT